MAQSANLTQRQWLNMIIWATAFMILLFTVVGKIISNKFEDANFNENETTLIAIQIFDWRATQQNGLWQQSQALLSDSALNALIFRWQTLASRFKSFDENDQRKNLNEAISHGSIYLSFSNHELQIELKSLENHWCLHPMNSLHCIVIEEAELAELIPAVLLPVNQ